ncbi:hypothetical protein Dxin01_03536 [Deinococcus xinjiangensis]|uniref:GGDEF domain-containing protein n=1 Tax=Deinococcus xinjiangensis TaxID=457454 RepID=A0ABP9VEW2_9DEIO
MLQPSLPDDLASAMTLLYFRLVLPLVAFAALWGTYREEPHDYRAVLPFCMVLLGLALVYPHAKARWQWRIRLGLALGHLVFMALLVVLAPLLGWKGGPNGIYMLLLVGPLTVLSWNFLFFDRPRLGWTLGWLLSVGVAALIARWLLHNSPQQSSLAVLVLICCLLALQFGWNVTWLQRKAAQSHANARQDALTGLPNRRAFDEACATEQRGSTLAVLDIDHFKRVNDTFGHPAGDRVLRGVADVLLDLLPAGGRAFRWDGEEFVLLLPNRSSTEVLPLLEKIRGELAGRSFVGGSRITLSGGLTEYTSREIEQAFGRADQALLDAKRNGRDKVMVL